MILCNFLTVLRVTFFGVSSISNIPLNCIVPLLLANSLIQSNNLLEEKIRRWRLVLGSPADPQGEHGLEGDQQRMDEVLEALYDSEREGGLGSSSPNVNRWLGDIRRYFPGSVVRVMQRDALEQLGLKQMLLEPELLESIEPDVHLVGALLNLKNLLPDKTRETARLIVRRIVEEIERRLRQSVEEAVRGALNRAVRNRRPRYNEIDWRRTIRANLRHYQPEYKTIIPEQLYGYGRKGPQLKHIVLLVDQSASMATSVVYAGVAGSILASLRAIRTHLIAFDTSVVDLSAELGNPVDLLFGAQLGGGTDINKALGYARQLIQRPRDTIVFLISDLYEGGNISSMIRHVETLKASGVQFVSLLALNDEGAPAFDKDVASQLANLDIPAFACTPDLFPSLLTAAIQREDISRWMGREGVAAKN
jgi:Mg-chelatase subunit ChlD